MPYYFNIGGQEFVGHTVPGASPIRIVRKAGNSHVAFFRPGPSEVGSFVPYIRWTDRAADVDEALLKELAYQVFPLFLRRLNRFKTLKEAPGIETGEGLFDGYHFMTLSD